MLPRKVILIGWDAADWKVIRPLMDAGQMPNLQRLVQAGAHGQIATLHPPFSPMLWTSIATGKRPFKHGIHGFSEPTPDGQGVQPVSNLSRKAKALWNILHQNHLRSVVLGWWPSHPAEPIHGVMVSNHYQRTGGPLEDGWPLPANCIHPPALAASLAALRMHPDRLTPEMVEPFIPLAREIDQDKDQRLSVCMRMLAECLTIQAAALWLIENQPWDFFAVYYDSIDHFCHGFMRYHPPRQSWIAERDFDLYSNVVAAAYRLHDRMLGALLEKAAAGSTVVLLSDHGFHPDHLRPSAIPNIPAGPAIEHRDLGILVMAGPPLKSGELLHGASLLDIAPTILALYGLPAGEDMDGKLLSQAFLQPPGLSPIPSWESVAGEDGSHPPYARLDPVAASEAMERMIALGYIERPDPNREIAVRKTLQELRYNLGESYQDAGRHLEAYELFSALRAEAPGDRRFAVRLFVSCQALGRLPEMGRIVEDLEQRRNRAGLQPPVVYYLKAQLFAAWKRYPEALAALDRIVGADLLRPSLLLQRAAWYLRLHRPGEAHQVYRQALALDPDNAQAHLGLAAMALRRRQFAAAAQSALEALESVPRDPLAHFFLGRALEGLREYQRAAGAFRAAIDLNPNFPQAHLRLAAILSTEPAGRAAALEHRSLARQMRRGAGAPELPPPVPLQRPLPGAAPSADSAPLGQCLVVVTGLPRSGTSMLMQMLAAGGIPLLSDGLRQADENNPRGYLELAAVKNLLRDARFLWQGRGKAVKIVAALLPALPPELPCRVILVERDLDELLDSQQRMLLRLGQPASSSPHSRRLLADEYLRILENLKQNLSRRPHTQLLALAHRQVIGDPLAAARAINGFLGGGLAEAAMAAAVDPALYRSMGPPA